MSEYTFLFLINLGVLILCGALFVVMPHITRKSYLFGVKIPLEQASSPYATAIKQRYIRTCIAGVILVVAISILQYALRPDLSLLAVMYLPLLLVAIELAAFIPSWKRAVRLKEEQGWHVSQALFAETSSSHTRGKLSALPWGWYIAGLIVVAVGVITVILRYPSLPDMIPTNFDFNMQPDRWVQTTWLSAMAIPLTNAGLLAIMFSVNVMIVKAKLQIDPAHPRMSFAQHRIYRNRMGHAFGFLALSLALYISVFSLPILFVELPATGTHALWVSVVLLIIPIAVLIAVQVKSGQGGNKIKVDGIEEIEDAGAAPSGEYKFAGHGDDKHWVLGMFYYNPEDPAYLVEDRFGASLGLNYARLPAKIAVAVLIIGVVAMYAWATVMLV